MRYSGIIALGLGNLAFAQDTPTPSPSASMTESMSESMSGTASGTATDSASGSPSSSATGTPEIPGEIGSFEYYGCTTSNNGHLGFTEAANSPNMDLSVCALSCPTRFFGVYDESCYCADEIDEDSVQKVADDVCDTVCPGNPNQFCGGEITSLRFARRQDVALNVALTVYIRVDDGPDDSIIPTGTVTETATVTDVVTSCAPSDTDCTVGTATSTLTTTVDGALPTININLFAIICYGDFCVPRFPCAECETRRVVCRDDKCLPEICPKGEEHNAHRLVICEGDKCEYSHCGDDCQKKIVCYGDDCMRQECIGDECNKKVVRHGDEYDYAECSGDDCFREEVCKGDECAPAPAPPAGATPPPPTGKAAPPAAGPAPPAGGAAPPAGGAAAPAGGAAAPAGGAAAPAGGEAPVASPAPECEGAECPPTAGSEKQLPALGMGVIAGLAFLL